MQIDTLSKHSLQKKTAAFAYFPLFSDRSSLKPPTENNKTAYIANYGLFQIPLFSEISKIGKNTTYEALTDATRVPCGSLLVRVEEGKKDENGEPLFSESLHREKAIEMGLVTGAPPYSEGVYSTHYYQKHIVEDTIFKYKSLRDYIPVEQMTTSIRETVSKQKKLSQKLRKMCKKKKFAQMSDEELIKSIFEFRKSDKIDFLQMNFFSQYISEIGFRFGLDMLFNCPRDQLYIAIVSINPPANYYKKERSLDKIVVIKELDFDSSIRTPKFKDSMFIISNVPVDYNTHLLVDIKSVKFNSNGKTEMEDFAWTIFPLFSVLDSEETDKKAQIFIRSGRHMIQLFSGGAKNDVVKSLQDDLPDTWEFLLQEKKRRVSSVNFLGNCAILLRCVDNQRFDYDALDDEVINYTYCENKYKPSDKGTKLSTLLPEGKTQKKYEQEVTALLRDKYGIPS
ncbi:unnamed protein product [Moneuplotes crassus]|uniref:Uncharacterized protein n=1 Tax=Euplotes crassus TaxID=5936 RepID=A0AAD1YAI9_EUPCR|nr:unnamed protein product [Moneuplotes crassus]